MPSSVFESRTRSTLVDEVDVAPAERLQLAAADAGQHERQEHGARLLVGERLRDAGDLGRLEDPPAPPRHLRPLRPLDRVRVDQLLRFAVLKIVVEDVDVAADGRRRVVAGARATYSATCARPDRAERASGRTRRRGGRLQRRYLRPSTASSRAAPRASVEPASGVLGERDRLRPPVALAARRGRAAPELGLAFFRSSRRARRRPSPSPACRRRRAYLIRQTVPRLPSYRMTAAPLGIAAAFSLARRDDSPVGLEAARNVATTTQEDAGAIQHVRIFSGRRERRGARVDGDPRGA